VIFGTESQTDPILLKIPSLFCKTQTPIENYGSSEPPIPQLHSLTELKNSLIKSTPAPSTFKQLLSGGATLNKPMYHFTLFQVNNQEDFSQVSKVFTAEDYKIEKNFRGLLWNVRLALWLWSFKIFSSNLHFKSGFPTDFTPFSPGLEAKFAIEEGEKNKAKIVFGGN
jgi:hypothetical protein